MRFKDFILKEEKEKHAVLAFGRTNPPTSGHQVLVNKVHDVAKQHKASHHVVLSSSQDKSKNPLSAAQKLKHARRFFPGTNVSVATREHPTFLQQAEKLHKSGVTHLHMVAGSDRVGEYHKILHKYNGTHSGALFNFKHIKVHSAGQRDPDAEGTSGMSASKLRAHAASGNYKEFKKGIPPHVKEHHAKELYSDVRKGMNIKEHFKIDLPLDDLFEEVLNEGVNDRSIFKAVFLSGGPGSGKDYVLDNTLAGHGLTEINSDKALEYLMDREGLDKRMPSSEKEAREFVRGKAKSVTELRQRLALQGRNGLIINGTGDDIEKIKKIKNRLDELGYESSMISVNTDDEVSKKRNIERGERGGRTVPEKIRKEKWDAVQKSLPEFKKMFGDNYIDFDNTEDLRTSSSDVVEKKKSEMMDIFKSIRKFVSQPIENEKAKSWMSTEIKKKDKLEPTEKEYDKVPHKGSEAHGEAMKLGLKYYGFGRYGKDGKTTHHVVNGKLIQDVNEDFDVFLNEMVTVTVSADTPEEVSQTLKLLKSEEDYDEIPDDTDDDMTQFSDPSAYNLLNLGRNYTENVNEDYLRDTKGKIRVFHMRKIAAKEAHTKNGTVYKDPKGYVVKIKGIKNVKESLDESVKLLREETRTSSAHTGQKITLENAKKNFKNKIQEIDYGTESGLSMAASGESIGRDMGEFIGKDGKATPLKKIKIKELTGDTTTYSIGAQKEDQLKKQGISLSSFRSKNPI